MESNQEKGEKQAAEHSEDGNRRPRTESTDSHAQRGPGRPSDRRDARAGPEAAQRGP